VKTHLTNIFDKLAVHNRFKAALCVLPDAMKRSAPK
jgi:DNA-binding NarL/FixJ family response regulator